MSSTDSIKTLLAASGGDTVKLFDISVEPRDPCILSYTPSPGSLVNSIKWNHTNLVVASAGEDKKISLWRKNGQSLGTIPVSGTESGDNIEESISTICFSNKPSRYLCSGGSGQVVRIWDLQRKRCIKWLKGHTDCITGVMYNCKDEHLASISLNGVLLMHNLASGAKAAELKDPNKQILRALDYSRISRHLLATAGDDGSIHLWDTTARNPKVSWLKQHSAPISGVSFSPSNDKMIATVGLDKKLYIFDSGSRRHSFCIPFDAPFSSLSFTDDGLKLAAGTSSGRVVFYDVRAKPQPFTMLRAYGNSEAVTSLCWQRSKPVIENDHSSTLENVLLGGAVEDSVLMPDPLPSASSGISASTSVPGSQSSNRSGSADAFSFLAGNSVSTPTPEETPIKSSLWTGGSLTRLHAPRDYNIKDDMEVFSPLVEVQPITPSLDKLWDEHGGLKKDPDLKTHFLYPSSRRVPLPEEGSTDVHPIIDWKSTSTSKQEDLSSFSQLTPTPSTSYGGTEISSVTPPEAWGGGERLSDKLSQFRQSINNSSRFPSMNSTSLMSGSMFSGMQDITLPASHNTNSNSLSISSLVPTNFRAREASKPDMAFGSSEASSLASSSMENLDSVNPSLPFTRRFSSYAERISSTSSFTDGTTLTAGSPKTKKTGGETKEELLNSWLARSDKASIGEVGVLPPMNGGGVMQPQRTGSSSELQHGANSFTFQLFQRSLEETLSSFQKSMHEDMRNLHIEIIRQFHIQEMETTNSMRMILENQAELMKEVISLRKETQQLRQLL